MALVDNVANSPTHTIVAGGDVMLGRRTASHIETTAAGDASFPWKYVRKVFSDADIAFVNLEGVASTRGKPLDKRYVFRFSPDYMSGLSDSGIDIVSLANNHALDYGYIGLCDTYDAVASRGMSPIGAGCNRAAAIIPAMRTLSDGTRVAFFAISEFYQGNTATSKRAGFAPFSPQWIMDEAARLKKENLADIVIVSVHAGIEHSFVSGKRIEKMYRGMIDGGVDVILGHHPHVPQPIERRGGGWIVYSLGNLIFDMHDKIPHTRKQILAEISIQDGQVMSVKEIPLVMNKYFQPVPVKKRVN